MVTHIVHRALAMVVSVVLFSCGSSNHSGGNLVQMAEKRYGGSVEYLSNSNGTFVVCLSKQKLSPGNPNQPVRFMVFDVERGKSVFEDSLDNAEIRWLDDHQLEVDLIPEVADDGSRGTIYVFDVRTGKRTPVPFPKSN